MRAVRVERQSNNLYCIIFITPYVTIHKMLEHINKFIERPVLMNSHKFVTCIKMSFFMIMFTLCTYNILSMFHP